jgi:hypothetical protein
MKIHALLIAIALASHAMANDVPAIFDGLLRPDTPVKGQIGMVLPPKEIDKYVAKVEAAARLDVKWFREFSKTAKPGVPLPYDEKLGLTKEEYASYLETWAKREFKPMEEVMLLLRKGAGGSWVITGTGAASAVSTLRYDTKSETFRSPNGEMKRIDDINADAQSILGAWTAKEWKFDEESSLGKTKENFAIGRFTGQPFGLIVHRVQELSSEGTRLLDKSLVIRFPLPNTAAATKPKPKSK